jgi:hypothetical protein
MTWNNFQKPVEYQGRIFGTKEMEFDKIARLPSAHREIGFELATGGSAPPIAEWTNAGWHVIDSHSVSETVGDYRSYIESSRGELSVAKNLYVATRSGWFSCRSACYLAAGRPAIVQDTGFSENLPTGEGLFAFSDEAGARESLLAAEADYAHHSRSARKVAMEFLDARHVLTGMLQRIGLM